MFQRCDSMPDILLIDDDSSMADLLDYYLPENFELYHESNWKQGLHCLEQKSIDLIILDIQLPDANALDVMDSISPGAIYPAPPIMMLSCCNEPETIIHAMKCGASDYLIKPINKEKLMHKITYILQYGHVKNLSPAILGDSDVMIKTKKLIHNYAQFSHPVHISGESGTGKELIAREIHRLSGRKNFIAQNCASVPEQLFESTMFGTVKGAFTDAVHQTGLFERAHEGSLHLDEIGELSPFTQGKLLRVIEDGMICRLGDHSFRQVNVRIISATNKDLKKEVQLGNFREDLFYRLQVLPLHLPPLRERREDIPLLVWHFCRGYEIDMAAVEKLMDYQWPGNIRELKNVLDRAAVISMNKRIRSQDILFL
jgi:DNA-binding NtrC family response regulator